VVSLDQPIVGYLVLDENGTNCVGESSSEVVLASEIRLAQYKSLLNIEMREISASL